MELFSKLYNRFISKSIFDDKQLCWDADTRYLREKQNIIWRKTNPGNPERYIREVHILEILFILEAKYGVKCDRETILRSLLVNEKSNEEIAHQLYIEGYCGMI